MAIFKLLIVVLAMVAFALGALYVYFWYRNQADEREHEIRREKLEERQELNEMVFGEGTGADDIDRELAEGKSEGEIEKSRGPARERERS